MIIGSFGIYVPLSEDGRALATIVTPSIDPKIVGVSR